MHAGNPVLTDFIRETIRRRGPVTFEWFMEQALYHPEFGYYSSGRCAIGRRGDYFTNVSVGFLFGRVLAAQFGEMWESLGRPDRFLIVEQGAHHGEFARDVLEALRERNPDFFSRLHYAIIEPFPILEDRQRNALHEFDEKLSWKKSPVDLDPFCGVHFSNELLDAMPVRLISRSESGWQERCVNQSGDELEFVALPITDEDLNLHLRSVPLPSRAPYETEVNLGALKWVDAVAQKLARGFVVMIDYGYPRDAYYSPERTQGTLRCYSEHRIVSTPFTAIGDVDITAHVDWTSVGLRAEELGLDLAGFADQHHFITGIASTLMANEFETTADAGIRRALQTLLHPELLGRTYQCLTLMKDVAPGFDLSGFRFARNTRVALGL